MKIQFSPYSLTKKNKVNALDRGSRKEGALIKVIDTEGHWGVADICPWPSLGDLPLKDEIRYKATLFQRAYALAIEDLRARQRDISLLKNKWVDNNVLVTQYQDYDFKRASLQGKTLKIKGDHAVQNLTEVLNAAPANLEFRIDFNGILTKDEFQKFLKMLSPSVRIEYIEDPSAYEPDFWNRWNKQRPLAADFIVAKENFQFKIIKPAREPIGKFKNFTITSTMDHPVGVAHALRTAQNFAMNKSGLLTLPLYEPTEFHDCFIYQNESEINFAPAILKESGIGMTAQLKQLKWSDSL